MYAGRRRVVRWATISPGAWSEQGMTSGNRAERGQADPAMVENFQCRHYM